MTRNTYVIFIFLVSDFINVIRRAVYRYSADEISVTDKAYTYSQAFSAIRVQIHSRVTAYLFAFEAIFPPPSIAVQILACDSHSFERCIFDKR